MAIAASSVLPSNSLEDFRLEFNNLVSDVSGITATNKFDASIIFEGATADAYETTLTVTDPTADRTITLPNSTGTVTVGGNPGSADGDALGSASLEWSDLYLADGGIIYFGNDQDITITHSADTGLTTNGTFQASTITATTAVVPDASDGAALGTTSLEWSDLYLADGAVIGFGDDQDVTLTHVADTGLLLSSTDQLQFGDSGTYIFQSADGVLDLVSDTEIEINATTIDINGNVEISGDLTVSGDDITMGTNTSGYILVADGTNYNPVAVSGDVTMSAAGAITIANDAIETAMLNDNIISGQTALTSGLATTDELLLSDGGTLKRVDVSIVTDLASGDATALAIALG